MELFGKESETENSLAALCMLSSIVKFRSS
jgi:hypothetical protein